jgi:predicted  nucleic acid-binding Zn-ribbon protein
MTISTDHTLKLLQASNDLLAMRKELDALKVALSKAHAAMAHKDTQIATLQAQLQRARLPFKRDQTAPSPLRRPV